MTICPFCGSEMSSGRSCTVDALHVGGRRYRLAPFKPGRGQRGPGAGRCGDCGVARGGLHHPGCELQRCPRCRRQLLSCGCRFDEDAFASTDDEWDDETWGDVWDVPGIPMGVDGNGARAGVGLRT